MVKLRTRIIESVAELRRAAPAWDELWRRSDVALPTVQAELVAEWVEFFAPQQTFAAVTVEHDGQLVAAVPLVEKRLGSLVKAGQLTGNCWAGCGDLLVDPLADVPAALDALIAQCRRIGWPLLWLDEIRCRAPRWQAMQAAAGRAGLPVEDHLRFYVAQVETETRWEDYQSRLSKGHRKHLRKSRRRLEAEAPSQVTIYDQFDPAQVDRLVKQCFEIEDRGWKGVAGTSVCRTPGMLDFFCRLARQLAKRGQLEIVILDSGTWPIAFDFGYSAKGVFFSHKIGYDAAYGSFGPGRLLTEALIQASIADPNRSSIDLMGPASEASSRWATRCEPVGRLAVGLGGMLGGALLHGYRRCWPLLRKLRGIGPAQPPQPGAAACSPDTHQPSLTEA